jgi:transcriptional regulator with XRE-family HTH domain
MSQEDLDRSTGEKLKELREQAGMSQEDLAFAAGIDQSGLSKLERIGPLAISWGRLCRIANVLGCEIEIVFRPTTALNAPGASKGVRHRGISRK